MPKFRCHNMKCAEGDGAGKPFHDFVAEKPVCPKCKAGSTPRTAHMVVKLAIVHFDPPTEVYGVGMGYPACQPAKTLAGIKATGIHSAVTCEACKETEAFKLSFQASKPWDELQEVEIDLKRGVITPKG